MTNVDIVRKAQQEFLKAGRPELKTGMEVEIHQKIKEGNKERIQRFKGIIIKTAGKSELEKTITVRRKIGAFGVEKIFAVHADSIEKIDVIRQFKVRRKSIKYIRDLTGKAARLKEVKMSKEELNAEKALPVIEYKETVKKEATKKTEKTEAKEEKNTEKQADTVAKDDLTKVEGIGPKIAEALAAHGITTFASLAKLSKEEIDEKITEVAGGHVTDTWPKQAQMAADGKWDELKKWQDELDGGKPAETK